ncbi:MAG: hypothetical protein M5U34_26125 [Chloroflexi bacterium]|nr:hypothetical protein [Chloroflexota bacterium]
MPQGVDFQDVSLHVWRQDDEFIDVQPVDQFSGRNGGGRGCGVGVSVGVAVGVADAVAVGEVVGVAVVVGDGGSGRRYGGDFGDGGQWIFGKVNGGGDLLSGAVTG